MKRGANGNHGSGTLSQLAGSRHGEDRRFGKKTARLLVYAVNNREADQSVEDIVSEIFSGYTMSPEMSLEM